jgi:uncharacterized protein (TIGR03643 family)
VGGLTKSADLSPADISRIIEMAWEDRTPFDAIHAAYGLNESAVIALMRAELKRTSFAMWRRRVSGRKTKHATRVDEDTGRHRANHRRQSG